MQPQCVAASPLVETVDARAYIRIWAAVVYSERGRVFS